MTTLSELENQERDFVIERWFKVLEKRTALPDDFVTGFQAGLAFNKSRIEELEAVKELLTALRPFAALWLDAYDRKPDNHPVWGSGENVITVGDVKAARTAVARASGEG